MRPVPNGLAVAIAIAALGACSDLQPIEPNVCGNHIIDVGEACDEGGETTLCTAKCRLSCVAEADAPATYADNLEDAVTTSAYCPAGQACGVDGLCAAPSGKFRAATSFQFDVSQAEVGDIDDDGVADLIGTNATDIRIQFGDSDGAPLTSVSDLPAPSATGPFLLGDFDGAFGSDLMIPSESGVVPYYATDSGTLQHRPVPTLALPREGAVASVDGIVFEPGGLRRPLLVFAEPSGNALVLRELTPAPPYAEVARCDTGGAITLRREPMPTAPLGNGDLIAVALDRTVNPGVCVFSPANPTAPGDPGWSARFLPLPAAARFERDQYPLLWANLDADACPELIAPTITGTAVGHAVFDSALASCSFATANTLTPSWGQAGPLLAAGNLDRVGADELVGAQGVFRVDSLTALTRLGPSLGMDRARVVDVNGDGVVDIVGTDQVVGNEARHEVLRVLRTAGAAGSWQSTTLLIETLRPVEQFVVGDYDGDRITDVALTEGISYTPLRVPTAMAVSIIYGQRSEIPKYQVVLETDPVLLATLGQRRGTVADQDATDDLGVAVISATGTNLAASVLYGSPQRSLTAPLALAGTAVAAIAAGRWANNDTKADLVVYSDTKQYLWPQLTRGFDLNDPGRASAVAPGTRRDVTFATATTSGGGTTVVSASPASRQAAVGGIGACPTAWVGTDVQSAGPRASLQVRNVDGSTGDEILLTSQPALNTQAIYLFGAIGADCKLGASLLPSNHPLLNCDAATLIEASTPGDADPNRREVLAVCRPQNGPSVLVRFDYRGATYVPAPLPVQLPGRTRRLLMGDFTGDGLEDVVSLTTVGAIDFATLLVQCAQTDAACEL
jgi:hypothetical protein